MGKVVKSLMCMLLAFQSMSAQLSKIDSLKTVLQQIEYPVERTDLYDEIAIHFYQSQLYNDSAYYYNEKAYQIAKEYNLPDKEGRALYNFAIIQVETGEINLAIENYLKSLTIFERFKDSYSISVINSSIGVLYFKQKKYDSAITFFNKAIRISAKNKDSISLAIDYTNLGEAKYEIGKYIEAKKHLGLAKKIAKRKGESFASLNIVYGSTLFALQEIDSSIVQVNMGLLLAKEDNDLINISEASNLLYRIESSRENYKEALMHYKNFVLYKDSLSVAKDEHVVEMLKLNGDLKEKEEAISRMEQKAKYMNVIYVLIGLGIILLVFLISKQIKVSKMTREIHDIQTKLIGEELDERSLKNDNEQL